MKEIKFILVILLSLCLSVGHVFACIGNVTSVLSKSQRLNGTILYQMSTTGRGKYTVHDNDGFFSVGLLYNLMVQTIGRENIPPECVQKEGFSENCEDLSKQSRRVYQKYKVAIREQLQRLKTYLEDQISFYIIMADPRDISIPEETRNHYIHLRSLAESILNDTNGVVESFDKDRNSRDVWRSLSRLRNLLNKNRSHFSYTVETRSGKETWTPYHANNDKNVFGSWDDVDIANEPPPTYRGIAKGIGGCGSYLSGDSEAPVFGGSTPRQGIPTDRPRTDN